MTIKRAFNRFGNIILIAALLQGLLSVPAACSQKGATALVNVAGVGDDEEEWRPTIVSVKRGGTVTWMNSGITVHWVISNDGLWSDQQLVPGHSFNYTFTKPGIYTYRGLSDAWTGTVEVR